ncbi:hypothetical protein GLOIN_2v1814550 [Rhizophagus irregularis DAOM 181602=DAOM 197198]|nr:hypothetical protein GLOIN_2v1814550 [Rhizophagus irregularis DAOM 181602=DAOM 197198]
MIFEKYTSPDGGPQSTPHFIPFLRCFDETKEDICTYHEHCLKFYRQQEIINKFDVDKKHSLHNRQPVLIENWICQVVYNTFDATTLHSLKCAALQARRDNLPLMETYHGHLDLSWIDTAHATIITLRQLLLRRSNLESNYNPTTESLTKHRWLSNLSLFWFPAFIFYFVVIFLFYLLACGIWQFFRSLDHTGNLLSFQNFIKEHRFFSICKKLTQNFKIWNLAFNFWVKFRVELLENENTKFSVVRTQ